MQRIFYPPVLAKRIRVGLAVQQLRLASADEKLEQVRSEVDKIAARTLDGIAWFRFDYTTDEVLIYVNGGAQ